MEKLSRRNFLGVLAVPAALGAAPAAAEGPVQPFAAMPLPTAASDEDFWHQLRQQFIIPANETFFNTCTLGATPRAVMDAISNHMKQAETTLAQWDYHEKQSEWLTGYHAELELRQKLARLINAETEEIALTQNATLGMNFLAHGLDMKAGDEVLTTDQEHPGGRCGWQMRVKRDGIVWKPLALGQTPDEIVTAFERAVTPRTRLLAFPHITSSLAIVMPVKRLSELAHARGALALVDGAQAIGHVRVDVRELGCDAYYSSPHKWLLAPPGSGLLWVRRDRMPQLWPTLASSEWENQKDPGFRLMQYGTGNAWMLKGFEAAVDFHVQVGPERIQKRILELATRLRAGLQKVPGVAFYSRLHPELACATTNWGIRGMTGQQIMDALWERERIRVRASGQGVRQCCHIYNSPEEVDRTIAATRKLAGSSRQ